MTFFNTILKNKKVIFILKYIPFILIAVWLLWIVYREESIDKIYKEFSQINIYWILLSAVLLELSNLIRALRWSMLFVKKDNINCFSAYVALVIGYFVNIFLPRIGEITRCSILSNKKTPFTKIFGTIISERIIDIIVLLLLLVIDIFLDFSHTFKIFFSWIDRFKTQDFFTYIWIGVGLLGLVFLIAFFILKKIKTHWIKARLKEFKVGVLSILGLGRRKKMVFLLYTFILWLGYYLMLVAIFQSQPTTSHLGPIAIFSVLIVGSVGMVIPTPGGIGSYHILVTSVFIAYGLEKSQAAGFTFIIHSLQLTTTLLIGFIAFLALPFLKKIERGHSNILK